MSISIREIAKLAGVSRGTVDRALNDREGINPEMKKHILKIAREAGYRSNRAGRMLGLRKNPLCLGVQMPARGNDFFLDVKCGLDRAAAELADFGLTLKIRTMKGYSVRTQIEQIRELLAEGINGLAFVPIDSPDVKELLQELAALNLPVVTFNNDISGQRLCYVGNDYLASGRIAAGLFGLIADSRPLEVLIMTGSVQVLGHNQRISGFCTQIKDKYANISIVDILENQDDDEIAYQLTTEALQKHPGLDAIYLTAAGVAGTCRALEEKSAGRTSKIICFDQTRSTEPYLRSGLITAAIGQEPFQQGYLPVKILFDYLLDGTKPQSLVHTRNEITIREHLPLP